MKYRLKIPDMIRKEDGALSNWLSLMEGKVKDEDGWSDEIPKDWLEEIAEEIAEVKHITGRKNETRR